MINVAQIGVGYWGPNLLRNLVANGRCNVKTVIELSEKRKQYVQSLYPSVQVSDETDRVSNDQDIQAVVIATPVATHFELAMKMLDAGKHVLVEKPMATSVAEVEQIGQLAVKKSLVAMVGHTFLYNSAVRYVKQLIDSRDLGDIRYIYSQRINLGRIRSDVDALWNLAPHDISIIQYWLRDPEPESISRMGMDYIQTGVQDVVFLNVIYPHGIMVNIHVSWLDPRRLWGHQPNLLDSSHHITRKHGPVSPPLPSSGDGYRRTGERPFWGQSPAMGASTLMAVRIGGAGWAARRPGVEEGQLLGWALSWLWQGVVHLTNK